MKHFRLARRALCLAARHLIPAIDGAVEAATREIAAAR